MVQPAESGVGDSITLFSKNGHTALDSIRLQLYGAEAGFDECVYMLDPLAAWRSQVVKSAESQRDERRVRILTVEITEPELDLRPSVEVVVDEDTGLRVSEKWRVEGETAMIITRRLVVRTPQISALLDPVSLTEALATLEQERAAKLDQPPYKVFQLDDPAFVLKNIVPGDDWNHVRLEYSRVGDPDMIAVVVSSWRLAEKRANKYPPKLIVDKNRATIETSDAGSRMCWAEDGTAIQLQAGDEDELRWLVDRLR